MITFARRRPSFASLGRLSVVLSVFLSSLAVFGLSGMASAQPVPEGATFRYSVREGDTCAGIARRLYGSARDYERIHALNPGLGPPPHRLEPGSVLVLPRPPSDGPDARVTAAENDVRARAPEGRFAPARVGDALRRGHRVETGARSSAELTFRDYSTVQMREETLVIVYGGSGSLAQRRATATLERGALRGRLAELSGRLSVSTPTATARIVGGDAVVAVGDDGSSRLSNHRARSATVTAETVSVRVPAGSGTLVRRGRAPAPPRPLPAPPRWSPEQSDQSVGLTGRGGTITGEFEGPEDAVAYRIEVARSRDGSDLVAAVEIPGGSSRFAIHRLPEGVYYVSIATIDDWLLEGRPSQRREVRVLSARVIPPGGGEPIVEPYDPGDPSEPDRLARVLPGTWIVAPVGFTCGPHGGEAAGMATLYGDGRTRVQCFDPAGREVPAFDVVLEAPAIVVDEPTTLLTRRVEGRVRVHLETALRLPPHLVAWAPAGVHVGAPLRLPGGDYEIPVTVATDGPERFSVTVGVAEGNDRVALAHFEARLRASERFASPHLPAQRATEPMPPAPGAFSFLPLPSVAPLLPTAGRGARVHAAFGVAGPPSDDAEATLRADFGIRARLFDSPIEVGFDWVVDASGDYGVASRRGQADVRLVANGALALSPDVLATLDLTTWVPTGAGEGSIADARLIPSLQIDGSFMRPLYLRTRQGISIDAGGQTLAWVSAYGADVRLVSGQLSFGVEAQLVKGRVDGADALAAGLGATAGAHLGPLDLVLAARLGIGPDASAILGDFGLLAAARVRLSD